MKRLWLCALLRCIVTVVTTVTAVASAVWALGLTDPLSMQADLTLFEGSGTKEDPFKVATADDLARLRDLVNEGDALAWGHFVQTADIDLAVGGDPAADWEPIGLSETDHCFHGDYDGAGHVIRNLRSAGRERAGLFDCLRGVVRNLGVASGYVRGKFAGTIAQTVAAGAVIVNCWSAATVEGESGAGGICHTCEGTLDSCWNIGTVTSVKGTAAGLSTSESGTYRNCASVGVAPTKSAAERDSREMVWYTTTSEAAAAMSEWYVGLLGYAVDPVCGEVTAAPTFLSGGDMAFEPMESVVGRGTTAYAEAVVGGMAVSQAGLVALAVLAAVALVARYWVVHGSEGGLVRGGQSLVGDTSLSASSDVRPQGTVPRGSMGTPHGPEQETAPREPMNARQLTRAWAPRIVALAVFCMVFLAGFATICEALQRSGRDTTVMANYYVQPTGCVDVLNVGSSRIGWNTDVAAMWSEYGISAYSLWTGSETFWHSYAHLREALRVSTPRVVVLEVHSATYQFEYTSEPAQYETTNGIVDLATKVQAVRASSPQESWMDMTLGFPVYHGRFDELTRKDFDPVSTSESFKGPFPLYGVSSFDGPTIARGRKEIERMQPKEEAYLRAIINLCQDKAVPLVLYAAPAHDYAGLEPLYSATEAMAAEYGLPFVNLNKLEGDDAFDADDFNSDNVHLNTVGARKVARLLATYLRDTYGLEDHRGDDRYASWECFRHDYENDYLKLITDLGDYAAELRRDGRTVVMVGHWVAPQDYAGLLQALAPTGLRLPPASRWRSRDAQVWLLPDTSSELSVQIPRGGDVTLGTHRIRYEADDVATIYDVDEPIALLDRHALVLVVYDDTTDEIVDVVRIPERVANSQLER